MTPRKRSETTEPLSPAADPTEVEFSHEAKAAFAEFGAYTNSRAIPDVRDGLKSGARRMLWAFHQASAVPGKPTRKAALLVGQVMAYHAHGDAGIYDTVVTMAHVPSDGAPTKKVIPLIYGQGSWGDPDNGAAASRYTEARLNEQAMMLLGQSDEILGKGEKAEVFEDGVRMVKNYTGELDEPVVLPALWPQFVINGVEGIGVGVSTSTPGHHPREVLDLALTLVDTDTPRMTTVRKILSGPELPADCDIFDVNGGIDSYLTTGRGQFIMRARYTVESKKGESGRMRHTMVVTGLPFRVSPSMVIAGINELSADGVIPPTPAVNLSDATGTRLEIDLGQADPEAMIKHLLFHGKKTRLQEQFSVNSWAIVGGQVRRVSTLDALRAWVSHRRSVIRHRSKFRLDRATERHEVVTGFLKAVPIAHLIVELVRASQDRTEAAAAMVARWSFTERQCQAILDMSVGQLSKLGVDKYESERQTLEARIAECNDLLSNPKALNSRLKEEIRAAKALFSDYERRCRIVEGDGRIEKPKSVADVIPAKKIVIARTSSHYLRQVSKRNINPVVGIDHVVEFIETSSHHMVDVVTNRGNLTRLKPESVPDRSTKADALIPGAMSLGERSVFASSSTREADLFTVTRGGLVKRTGCDELSRLRPGRTYSIMPTADDEVAWAFYDDPTLAGRRIVGVTEKGYVAAVDANDEVFRAKGRSARGNPLMRVSQGDRLVWVGMLTNGDRLVAWTQLGGAFTFTASQLSTHARGTKGTLVCHHKSPLAGVVSGSERTLMIFHPELEQARAVDTKTLTSGVEVKRPVVVDDLAKESVVAWLAPAPDRSESSEA